MTATAIRRLRGVCVGAGLVLTAALLPATAASASTASDIASLRQATAAFHNLSAAENAGYVQFLPCFDLPGTGGMGQHFVKGIDASLDPLQPEALVYEPRSDGYHLVAVEYIVPMALWTGQDPPMLFGQTFHAVPSLGVWALHVWLWRPNPLGMFADFNPNARLCPAT